MKILRATFRGLIGIYRSSNKKEITIDFTKCNDHPIILIMGPNGSGKSTIMDSLHILPDDSSRYQPGEFGYKELDILDKDTIYHIRIEYPINNKTKDRAQTRAYIKRNVNGNIIELNPNGNITSYRDAIYDEFNLDANFMQLSYLSVENRAIVDLRPYERKKYVGNIITQVEVYNNILKTLNKRANQFKTFIASLSAKISNIGDEDILNTNINSITNRIKRLKDEYVLVIAENSKVDTLLSNMEDDFSSVDELANNIDTQIRSISEQLDMVNLVISKLETIPSVNGQKSENILSNEINAISKSIIDIDTVIATTLTEKEVYAKNIIKISHSLSENNTIDIDIINSRVDEYKKNISSIENVLLEMGLTPDTTLTKDEFITGINTINVIKEQIDVLRSYNFQYHIETAIRSDYNELLDRIMKLSSDISKSNECIEDSRDTIQRCEEMISRLSILDNRHKDCNIDDCAFIKEAVNIRDNIKPYKLIEESNNIIEVETESINHNQEFYDESVLLKEIKDSMNIIFRYIDNNIGILCKFDGLMFLDKNDLLIRIANGDTFSDNILSMGRYIDNANLLEIYNDLRKKLDIDLLSLKEYEIVNKNRESLLEELDELNKNTNDLSTRLIELQSNRMDMINNKIQMETDLNNMIELKSRLEIRDKLSKELSLVENKKSSIYDLVSTYRNTSMRKNNIEQELEPLENELNSIKFSLQQLNSYREEYDRYQKQYTLVETLIKYSSPTEDGIQLLFMEVYMGQIMDNANALLSMLFDGRLRLDKFIINDKEFRIPCKSMESSIMNDDISSCSTSERCMISMIISFALLRSSSSKYNILRLDEIDGGLDVNNRSQFIPVLLQIMDMLTVENCIMISHSSEIPIGDCNVISLYKDQTPGGNVIFTLNDPINKTI